MFPLLHYLAFAGPPASCMANLNAWCNVPSNCPDVNRCGKGQQFFAARSTSYNSHEVAYRCYAASNLDASHRTYNNNADACYCTRNEELTTSLCECEHRTTGARNCTVPSKLSFVRSLGTCTAGFLRRPTPPSATNCLYVCIL